MKRIIRHLNKKINGSKKSEWLTSFFTGKFGYSIFPGKQLKKKKKDFQQTYVFGSSCV